MCSASNSPTDISKAVRWTVLRINYVLVEYTQFPASFQFGLRRCPADTADVWDETTFSRVATQFWLTCVTVGIGCSERDTIGTLKSNYSSLKSIYKPSRYSRTTHGIGLHSSPFHSL
jgi:hypothetical protein